MFTNHFLGLRGVSFHVNGRVQAGGPAHQQQGQYGGLQAGAAVPAHRCVPQRGGHHRQKPPGERSGL